jgi:hypothetical protein
VRVPRHFYDLLMIQQQCLLGLPELSGPEGGSRHADQFGAISMLIE